MYGISPGWAIQNASIYIYIYFVNRVVDWIEPDYVYTFHWYSMGTLWRSNAHKSQQFRKENVVTCVSMQSRIEYHIVMHNRRFATIKSTMPLQWQCCMPNVCWNLCLLFVSFRFVLKEAIMSKIWAFAYRFLACDRCACVCVCVAMCA